MFMQSKDNWAVSKIVRLLKSGTINLDHVVQRGEAWNRDKKSKLIDSMILSIPTPHIFSKRVRKEAGKMYIHFILDGKQRFITCNSFTNNEFALGQLQPFYKIEDEYVHYDKEYEGIYDFDNSEKIDISGMRFSELPEDIKDKILNYTFPILYFDNLTNKETDELFLRINNSQPLTTKNKALAASDNKEQLFEIGKHDIFKTMLSEKKLNSKLQIPLVIKTQQMLFENIGKISFESREFNKAIENSKPMTDEEIGKINRVYDYAVKVHEEISNTKGQKGTARKFYTETHFVSLIPFINNAIGLKMKEKDFAEWVIFFYGTKAKEGSSISSDYNDAATKGSARSARIVTRNVELQKSFNDFFEDRIVDGVMIDSETEDVENTENETETVEAGSDDNVVDIEPWLDNLDKNEDDTIEEAEDSDSENESNEDNEESDEYVIPF